MKNIIIFIILAFMSGGSNSSEVSFEHATYIYPEFGIAFKYPKEWSLKGREDNGDFLLALSKDGKGFTHSSSILLYGNKPENMEFINGLLEEDDGMHILDDKRIIINNQKARQVNTEVDDDGVMKTEIFVIFEDEGRSLIVKSGRMSEGSTEYKMFFEIISTIKLISE